MKLLQFWNTKKDVKNKNYLWFCLYVSCLKRRCNEKLFFSFIHFLFTYHINVQVEQENRQYTYGNKSFRNLKLLLICLPILCISLTFSDQKGNSSYTQLIFQCIHFLWIMLVLLNRPVSTARLWEDILILKIHFWNITGIGFVR